MYLHCLSAKKKKWSRVGVSLDGIQIHKNIHNDLCNISLFIYILISAFQLKHGGREVILNGHCLLVAGIGSIQPVCGCSPRCPLPSSATCMTSMTCILIFHPGVMTLTMHGPPSQGKFSWYLFGEKKRVILPNSILRSQNIKTVIIAWYFLCPFLYKMCVLRDTSNGRPPVSKAICQDAVLNIIRRSRFRPWRW